MNEEPSANPIPNPNLSFELQLYTTAAAAVCSNDFEGKKSLACCRVPYQSRSKL